MERAPFPGLLCGRGVGSSILASLSEAGGNDQRQPACKPLPPCSLISVGRHSESAPLCPLASGSPFPSEEWPPPILCFRLGWQRQKILRSLFAPAPRPIRETPSRSGNPLPHHRNRAHYILQLTSRPSASSIPDSNFEECPHNLSLFAFDETPAASFPALGWGARHPATPFRVPLRFQL